MTRGISEARFQAQVIQMARTFGWAVAHFRPGMDRRGNWKTAVSGDGAGFPDLVLAYRNQEVRDIIHAEIKSDLGKLTPAQEEWLRILDGVVWRPKDFDLVRARLMCHHLGPRRGDDAPGPRHIRPTPLA
jgi:hypothetical protein